MKSNISQAFTKKAAALQYDTESKLGAPKVIASGKSHLAEQIISKAQEFDIPIFENRELADSLLGLEVNQEIPEELYRAVTEVFVWLMRVEKN